jgi:hypothetical protein
MPDAILKIFDGIKLTEKLAHSDVYLMNNYTKYVKYVLNITENQNHN